MTRAFLVITGGPKGIRTPVTDVRVKENALFRHS